MGAAGIGWLVRSFGKSILRMTHRTTRITIVTAVIQWLSEDDDQDMGIARTSSIIAYRLAF